MSYIEIKTISGRQYKYLRKSVRDGKKMSHITLKYLGPVNPVYKVGKRQSSNASVYVHALTQEEIGVLKRATKSNNAFKRDRARILLLSSKGYFARQIAESVGCEGRKVRNAIKAYNENGLNALEKGKAKGAKPKFTNEQKAKMLEIASTDPVKLGLHFTTWSLRKLKRYFEDRTVVESISIVTIRSLFKSEGMHWKKSKRFQYSNDPNFAKKNF